MKRIACFCIPAHGHTNPMLPVAAELVRRGNAVRFYSFREFEEKIRATKAEFVACDDFMPALTAREVAGLKTVSTTEMTVQDIRITLAMDDFLSREFADFQPDVVYTDSVCFWGKLNALKHRVPMVVSVSTFAFNQMSSRYMKNSPKEMADMIFGLPRISKALQELETYGYHVKSALSLVQNDNDTDSVVYTSRRFQPYAESFSGHYAFVGPSVFSNALPEKAKERPLIYISMGTVINDRPDFYAKCVEALKDRNVDVVISCGDHMEKKLPANLPDNIRAYSYVNQLEILAKADVFITHCGMNSVSESLYMATPMVLYPQTGEQCAVARRAAEMGAGVYLRDDSPAGIGKAVEELLSSAVFAEKAAQCSADFRGCPGPAGAAEFIENAPHESAEEGILDAVNRKSGRTRGCYWLTAAAAMLLTGLLIGWNFVWVTGIAAGLLSYPVGRALQNRIYQKIASAADCEK